MSRVTVEISGNAVALVCLNRPEKLNAIDGTMRDELFAVLSDAIDDRAVRAIVLAGVGDNFSAGGDIDWMRTLAGEDFLAYHRKAVSIVRVLATSGKPIIAAIEGACAGGAAGFALCCDYIVMAETARFGVPFLRIALAPDMGAAYLLSRRIGQQMARRMIFEGRMIDGVEADRIGLADHTVPKGEAVAKAGEVAARLARLPPRAVAQTKWLLRRADVDFERFIEDELAAQAPCLLGEEFAEGASAFLEKRPPRY